jgi:uncharacterized surface protein with fasciclin (FAS1) repeats
MSANGLLAIGALVTLIVTAAMALLIYAAILDGRDPASPKSPDHAPPQGHSAAANILQAAHARGSFDTLMTAVDRAGLRERLERDGPYTVFAPSDDAFAKLPAGVVDSLLAAPDTLADVVNYHLVPGRMTSADVAGRRSAETLQGESLVISNNGWVRVDGARVVSGDIEASNGVIHVIDRVLLPARI